MASQRLFEPPTAAHLLALSSAHDTKPVADVVALTRVERDLLAHVSNAAALTVSHLTALRQILEVRNMVPPTQLVQCLAPGDASQLSAPKALETAQTKQQEAQARADAMEMEKRTLSTAKEALKAQGKEQREKRMKHIASKLMGKNTQWVFERWCDAMDEDKRGDTAQSSNGPLTRAKKKISELENEIIRLRIAVSPNGFGAVSPCNKNQTTPQPDGLARKCAQVDSQQLDVLYTALAAAHKDEEEHTKRLSEIEAQHTALVEARAQCREGEDMVLRTRRLRFVLGRLMNKELMWAFEVWFNNSSNGQRNEIALAKRKHAVLSQKLATLTELAGNTRTATQRQAAMEQVQNVKVSLEKHSACTLELGRRLAVKERAERNEMRKQNACNADNSAQKQRIFKVFEQRVKKQQQMGSVMCRLTDWARMRAFERWVYTVTERKHRGVVYHRVILRLKNQTLAHTMMSWHQLVVVKHNPALQVSLHEGFIDETIASLQAECAPNTTPTPNLNNRVRFREGRISDDTADSPEHALVEAATQLAASRARAADATRSVKVLQTQIAAAVAGHQHAARATAAHAAAHTHTHKTTPPTHTHEHVPASALLLSTKPRIKQLDLLSMTRRFSVRGSRSAPKFPAESDTLKRAQESIRSAVWEYTSTLQDVALLSRNFHAWHGCKQDTRQIIQRSMWISSFLLKKLGFRCAQTVFKSWGYIMLRTRRLRATFLKIFNSWVRCGLQICFFRWHVFTQQAPSSLEKRLRIAHDLIAQAISAKSYREGGGQRETTSHVSHRTPDRDRHDTSRSPSRGTVGRGPGLGGLGGRSLGAVCSPFSPRTAIVL